MKNKAKVLILLLIAIAIGILPLVMIKDSEFEGADDAASDMVEEINPGYTPWLESLYEPPGSETESLLFALQASLGAAVLGGGFGYLKGRKDGAKSKEGKETC